MLGYGLGNYFIHKFSIEGLIVAFLNRMVIPNASYLVGIKILATNIPDTKDPKQYLTEKVENLNYIKEEVENLYNSFIEDEYYMTRARIEDYKSSNLEVDYQKELYKYILSSNILASKDYNFDKKSKQEVISEGESFLKIVFENVLTNFLNDITVQFSNDPNDRILNLLKMKTKNLLLSYNSSDNSSDGTYSPKTDIKDTLNSILGRYSMDIRGSNESGFYKFYSGNNYTKIRDTYLDTLKKQISSTDDRRII